jgi:hypothetical protein
MRTRSFTTRIVAVAASLALGGAGLGGALPAAADTAPAAAEVPATVGSAALPTAQLAGTNAIGWSTAVIGTTVFVGGSFSAALPPGATSGQVARGNLMSYDVTTGALGSFAPSTNGQVRTITASPDGTRLYIGGDFTTVNGVKRNRIAAINAATGALLPWNPNVNATVRVIRATASTVYFGGSLTSVGGTARSHAAAVTSSGGGLTAWAPTTNNAVQSMAISPDGAKIALGGFFNALNGATGSGFGIVDAVSGRSNFTTPITQVVTDGSTTSAIWGMSSDATNVYASGYYSQTAPDRSGNLEGTFAVNWSTGATTWLEDCHGDEYQSAVLNGAVYVVGHPHYCGDIDGGFAQISIKASQRAVAFTAAATAPVKQNTLPQPRYFDFAGQPGPSLLAWFPTLAVGTASGSSQAAWYVAAAGNYIVMTGEFPTVNGVRQYGNARFATASVAKDTDGPQLSGSAFPVSVTSSRAATARIAWSANNDHDSETLSYTLFRGATAIYSVSAASRLWYRRPLMTFVDNAVAPGSTYAYRVVARDPSGNSATSATVSFTVPSTSAGRYAQQVLADGATSYWRLNEASGALLADAAGTSTATVHGNVVLRSAGALVGDADRAALFDGSSSTGISTRSYEYPGDTFSVEAWFRTTSATGGEILGGGDQRMVTTTTATNPQTGQPVTRSSDSLVHDRGVATTADGHVTFTVSPGTAKIVTSSKGGYNDGKWHHVVGTLGSAGQVLYVDGVAAASDSTVHRAVANAEYWRIGGDSGTPAPADPSAPPAPPVASPNYFTGSIDEPAVYVGTALTAGQVAAHHLAGLKG